jgi:septal ring-binding cell division protein DamX
VATYYCSSSRSLYCLSLSLGGYYLYDYNGVFGLFSPKDSVSIAEDAISHSSDSTSVSEKEDATKKSEKVSEDITEEEIEEEEPIEETNTIKEPKEDISETPRYKSKPVSRSNRDFRNVPKVKKKTEADDNKSISKDQPNMIKNTKDLPFSLDENERGVFTVQIYSTLSEDDALDWLVKLKQKNIGSAFISQQKIRDKVWYRVRFGAYQTERDAKEAAAKYGFAQSWIDRVK